MTLRPRKVGMRRVLFAVIAFGFLQTTLVEAQSLESVASHDRRGVTSPCESAPLNLIYRSFHRLQSMMSQLVLSAPPRHLSYQLDAEHSVLPFQSDLEIGIQSRLFTLSGQVRESGFDTLTRVASSDFAIQSALTSLSLELMSAADSAEIKLQLEIEIDKLVSSFRAATVRPDVRLYYAKWKAPGSKSSGSSHLLLLVDEETRELLVLKLTKT